MSDKKTYEEYQSEMNSYNRIDEAAKTLAALKLELGVRKDNVHVGTGLGGNHAELFFLMNHRVRFVASEDEETHFVHGDNNEVILQAPLKHNLLQVRKAFTEFYNSHPDKKDLTQEQMMNPSFLRDLNPSSIELKVLIHALEETLILQKWLDAKLEFRKQLRGFFHKETEALQVHFLREMKLPENYISELEAKEADRSFRNLRCYEADPIRSMFRKHPLWGAKNAAVEKRLNEIEDRLLSQEDNEKLRFIGSCPQHIALFVFRSIIQIDRIVALNLDENENCKWLEDINRGTNSLNKKDVDEDLEETPDVDEE